MDIYGTATLNRTVDSLKRPASFLLNAFFPQMEFSDTEEIYFDVEIDGKARRLTPLVHPMRAGKIVESRGFKTNNIKPAYAKDKRVHVPHRALRRMIGETIGTGQEMTPQQRAAANLQADLRDQVDMLARRKEVMASEALRLGQVTVKGEGYDTVVVDFARHNDLTINLGSGEYWGDSGVSPLKDIQNFGLDVLKLSGGVVRDIVMEPEAFQVFAEVTGLKEKLDSRKGDPNMVLRTVLAPEHVQYMGTDGAYRYWVYADWYIDPDTEEEVPILPRGTVLGVSQSIMGVQHHGAIMDQEAIEGGMTKREFFVKSWVEKDPSARYLLMQSSPLVAPYRANACWAANVLAPLVP